MIPKMVSPSSAAGPVNLFVDLGIFFRGVYFVLVPFFFALQGDRRGRKGD